MKSALRQKSHLRAGLAIGPILFVVAILAVLVAALAAGSGGIQNAPGTEQARTNGAAIMAQGTNIRMGAQRVLSNSAIAVDSIRTVGTSTTDTSGAGIFTAAGGSVPPQNPPGGAAGAGALNNWTIATGYLGGVGLTGTPADISTTAGASGADLVALISVTQPVCQQINRQNTGVAGYWIVASAGTSSQVGDTRFDTTSNISNLSGLPITGRAQGCVANQADTAWYYFQLLLAN